MTTPIRLFIGSSSNGEDAAIEAVYEYTLRKNLNPNYELEIIWMRQTHDNKSHWHGYNTHSWPTPFSGYRWAIPEYCGFQGRAIYTDVDMINFRSISDLWETDLEGRMFAARKGTRFGGHEFCVMVIDCEKAKDHLIPVARQRSIDGYHQRCISTFSGNGQFVTDLDPRWNCLDGDGRQVNEMYQLHWTKMATQPWLPRWFSGNPEKHPRQDLVDLFHSLQTEAAAAGYEQRNYIPNDLFGPYDIIGR